MRFATRDLDMRPYEVETRPKLSRGGQKQGGRARATLATRGSGATATVDAETAEGVKVTVAIDCRSIVVK